MHFGNESIEFLGVKICKLIYSWEQKDYELLNIFIKNMENGCHKFILVDCVGLLSVKWASLIKASQYLFLFCFCLYVLKLYIYIYIYISLFIYMYICDKSKSIYLSIYIYIYIYIYILYIHLLNICIHIDKPTTSEFRSDFLID